MSAKVRADIQHPILGSTHKNADTFFIGNIQNLDNRADVLKLCRLLTCLFLGHVVHADKLVISKKNSIHGIFFQSKLGTANKFFKRGCEHPFDAVPSEVFPTSVCIRTVHMGTLIGILDYFGEDCICLKCGFK